MLWSGAVVQTTSVSRIMDGLLFVAFTINARKKCLDNHCDATVSERIWLNGERDRFVIIGGSILVAVTAMH